MDMNIDPWIADPTARLQVWRVRIALVGEEPVPIPLCPLRVPAYTAGEAVQLAAAQSGLPRAAWSRYAFYPDPMRTTP